MKKMIKSLIVGAAMVGIAGVANAIPTIYVSSTGLAGSWTAVASSSTGNFSTPSETVGVWNFVVGTGLTMPAVGSSTAPIMDLSISGSSTAAGSLYIAFAATGFNDISGGILASFSGHVVSGASETYSFTTYADTSNSQPTTTLPTGNLITTLSGTLPSLATAIGTLPATVPNTLEEVVELTAAGVSTTSDDAGFSPVPDGGVTALLLGAALSGLALFRRKVMA